MHPARSGRCCRHLLKGSSGVSPLPVSVRKAVGHVRESPSCLKETHPLPTAAGPNVASDQVQRCVIDKTAESMGVYSNPPAELRKLLNLQN